MQFISKVIVWMLWFAYRYSGLESLVSWADTKLFIYRKRLQMVPTTFKWFVWMLGLTVGISGSMIYYEAPEIIAQLSKASEPMVFVQHAKAEILPVKVVEPVEEWKKAEFSAYTASADETDSSPLIMASGKMVYIGSVACPRSMKLGTRIEVRGLGEFVCEDRMNERYTNHFDIFMLTKSEAMKFGRKMLEYRVQ